MRIVIVNGGLQGTLNASLGLIERLHTLGHHVTFACPRTDLTETIDLSGAAHVVLPPWEPVFAARKAGPWLQRAATRPARLAQAVAALGTVGVPETLAACAPDLVLIEIEMSEHILVARAAGLPVAALCGFQSIWRRPGLPPMGSTVVPGDGLLGSRPGLAALWAWAGLSTQALVLAQRARSFGLDRRAVLAAHANAHGRRIRLEYGCANSLLLEDLGELPVLCLNAPELDFPHTPATHLHFAGPMIRQTNLWDGVTSEERPQIERLLAPSDRPLVYVGSSTLARGDASYLQRLAQMAQQRPDWDVVAGLGAQSGWKRPGNVPANLHLLRYAPQIALLQRADAAVLGAGINSIYEGLWHAVPMLVQSLGVNDQNGNVARLRFHGLAYLGDRTHDSASAMVATIKRLMADQDLKRRLSKTQAQLKAYPARLPDVLASLHAQVAKAA